MALPCEGLNELNYSIIVNNSCTGDVRNVPATDVTIYDTIITLNLSYVSIIDDTEIQDIYISVCNDVGCTTSDAIDTGIVYQLWYYSPPSMNKHMNTPPNLPSLLPLLSHRQHYIIMSNGYFITYCGTQYYYISSNVIIITSCLCYTY